MNINSVKIENKVLIDENSLINNIRLDELAKNGLIDTRRIENGKSCIYLIKHEDKFYRIKSSSYGKLNTTIKIRDSGLFHDIIRHNKHIGSLYYNYDIGSFEDYEWFKVDSYVSDLRGYGLGFVSAYSFKISIIKIGNRRGSKVLNFSVRIKENTDCIIMGETKINQDIYKYIEDKCISEINKIKRRYN